MSQAEFVAHYVIAIMIKNAPRYQTTGDVIAARKLAMATWDILQREDRAEHY